VSNAELRRALDAIIAAVLRAADPAEAIRRHVRRDADTLWIGQTRYDLTDVDDVRLLAAGKAAVPMAEEVLDILGRRVSRAIAVTKYGHAASAHGRPAHELTIIEAGHPIPDENSRRGGAAVWDALHDCSERTLVIACVSGGASALLVAPHEGISLGALRAINDALLRCGAEIGEMNAVRSRLDRLKGGGLVRRAQPARVVGLILSDVIGDPLDVIASGLTNDPRAVNELVGNNTQACLAAADAARDLGLRPHIVTTELRGEARAAGVRIAREALMPSARMEGGRIDAEGECLIFGGETTVTVRGDGKGGRNQELALAAAIELATSAPTAPVAIAALGTDGTDGPTDAAGAIAFADTVRRARELGQDPSDALSRNDSYRVFERLGDLIMTGPTGTNVADVVIALSQCPSPSPTSTPRSKR
jgi:hydroxypyruvate reductase